MLRRALRWQPRTYWQVLALAVASGLIFFITWTIFSVTWTAAGGSWVLALVVGLITCTSAGAGASYRLDRDRDARTVSDWVQARARPVDPELRATGDAQCRSLP
ncbi:MAG: hypothetical protein ACRDY2_01310 [Acidimicrobiales bacterium]